MPPALPQPPASASAQAMYPYSANTSTSTVSQTPRSVSVRDSRASPHPSAATPQPPGAEGNILERQLNATRGAEVSLSAWSFLFAEIVAYSQSHVDSVADLEKRLTSLGYEAGQRVLSLLLLRNAQAAGMKDPRRENRLIPILQFVHTQVYKYCFGRPADGLERSVEGEDECGLLGAAALTADMITMNQPPLTQHISIPKDMSQLSCEAFTAGIVEGVLDGLDVPSRVTAHTVATDQYPQRTVILVKLDARVMDREAGLSK
ncbi:Trafficking protein particle complex subunit 31 [Vanrija albida]|uniref:Trafficking protein particle complex subunit n=1 Tax=Vanrija albida TaxID=181172 RepID=A0ABR3PXB3_9TREE